MTGRTPRRPSSRGALLAALTMALLAAAPSTSSAQQPPPEEIRASAVPEIRDLLAKGWGMLDLGQLRQAEEAFEAAMAHPRGRSVAEVHFALAAIWWEKHNAMASYQRLVEARQAASEDFAWDGGDDGHWDQRIAARIEWIERNFTAVKLRLGRGSVVPPLADPPPADPLLRSFTDGVAEVVDEATGEGVPVVWLLLPNGNWWVGDEVKPLEGGQLDATRAEEWVLPRDAGRAARQYRDRTAAIERGESPAAELLAKREGGDTPERQPETGPQPGGGPERPVEPGRVRVALAGGAGFVTVPQQAESPTGTQADAAYHGELALIVPLRGDGIGLRLGGSANNLPVSACPARQLRAHTFSGHAGLRLAAALDARATIAGHVGLHVGGGVVEDGSELRTKCAESRLEGPVGEVRYGVKLAGGDLQGLVSYADLGWSGRSVLVGPDGEIGVLVGGLVRFGVGLFVRYDQVVALLDRADGPAFFRDQQSGQLGTVTAGEAAGRASMPRLQVGVRGQVVF